MSNSNSSSNNNNNNKNQKAEKLILDNYFQVGTALGTLTLTW